MKRISSGKAALRIRVRVKKPGAIQKRLDELAETVPESFAAALYQEGLALDALANSAEYIPVDTGRMRATHFVAPPTRVGRRLRVLVGYGTDYALFVHERTEAKHQVGQARWLLKAFSVRASGFHTRLAKRTEALARQGVGVQALTGAAPSSPQDPGPSRSAAEEKAKAKKAREKKRAQKAKRKAAKQQKRQARGKGGRGKKRT